MMEININYYTSVFPAHHETWKKAKLSGDSLADVRKKIVELGCALVMVFKEDNRLEDWLIWASWREDQTVGPENLTGMIFTVK